MYRALQELGTWQADSCFVHLEIFILFSTFICLSKQYEDIEFAKRIEPRTTSFLQYNSVAHEPTNFQYSSFGSQSASTESNQVSPGPFIRRPYTGYQNGLDDKFRETRDYEDRQRINKFPEGREFESRQSDEKIPGLRDFEGRQMEERFPGGPKEYMGRQRNDKYQAAGNFEQRERNDKFQSLKDFEVRRRIDKFQGPRDLEQHRTIRYEEGFRGLPMNEPEKPSRPGKPWHSSHFSEHRGRQRRPRTFSASRRTRENLLADGKRPFVAEIKRSPRIVKYIADKNGFAIREDLIKPLQETIDRTRQESRRRIVTASAAGLPQSSLSQVVTSAIRVAGQSNGNGEGKFLPQIFDLSVGKRPGHLDIDKLAYSLGAKELIL
ncbi:uncharacterized protein CDAR_269991 [Caerostris darwini]|uniref:Uncharacterized protein n=1 Tax=Caerostris darwini TaxID=1538125 RepID=A0AAV4RRH8_9ARAC|nr:uncharacterized protein CDAR_269991 [Caerostris darwini]